MQGILSVMQEVFDNTKSCGSYFALLLAAIYILFRLNEKKNFWYTIYTVFVILLVCMNPFLVYGLSKAFPVLANYRVFVLIIPVLLIVPFALTELLDKVHDTAQSRILLVLMVLIIALAGNMFGLYQGNTDTKKVLSGEEKEVIAYLEEAMPELIVADEELLPFLRTYGKEDFQLLYGRDLYQAGADFGIMDGYDEELLYLYEAMKNPAHTIKDALATAELYGCDTVVVKSFDKARKKYGHFTNVFETENYIVYSMQ